MRLLRAGQRVARRLNCGVMRLVERLAKSLVLALAASACLSIAIAQPQSSTTVIVRVFRDHFEVGGQRFSSSDELREITRGRSIGYSVRECGADAKVRELMALLWERAGGRPFNVLQEHYPLQC
jgi:hypothetical protein